jgi:hypothetical protein
MATQRQVEDLLKGEAPPYWYMGIFETLGSKISWLNPL